MTSPRRRARRATLAALIALAGGASVLTLSSIGRAGIDAATAHPAPRAGASITVGNPDAARTLTLHATGPCSGCTEEPTQYAMQAITDGDLRMTVTLHGGPAARESATLACVSDSSPDLAAALALTLAGGLPTDEALGRLGATDPEIRTCISTERYLPWANDLTSAPAHPFVLDGRTIPLERLPDAFS